MNHPPIKLFVRSSAPVAVGDTWLVTETPHHWPTGTPYRGQPIQPTQWLGRVDRITQTRYGVTYLFVTQYPLGVAAALQRASEGRDRRIREAIARHGLRYGRGRTIRDVVATSVEGEQP